MTRFAIVDLPAGNSDEQPPLPSVSSCSRSGRSVRWSFARHHQTDPRAGGSRRATRLAGRHRGRLQLPRVARAPTVASAPPIRRPVRDVVAVPGEMPTRWKVAREAGSIKHLELLASGVPGRESSKAAITILALVASLARHDPLTRVTATGYAF